MPGIGIGAFLVAIGAILTFGLTVNADGADLDTIGVILMIVGGVTALASMVFWTSWFGTRRDGHVHEDRIDHVHGH